MSVGSRLEADGDVVPPQPPEFSVLAEPGRVARVQALVRASAPNQRLEELAALACRLTGAPMATVSLVGERAQVVTAAHGLHLEGEARRVPLEHSMCALTAATGAAFAVEDARTHAWVADRPAVRSGQVSSYLGAPICDELGRVVGALAVHGPEPRTWSGYDVTAIAALAQSAAMEYAALAAVIEAGSATGTSPSGRRAEAVQLELAVEAAQLGVFSYDVATGALSWDERMLALHGRAPEERRAENGAPAAAKEGQAPGVRALQVSDPLQPALTGAREVLEGVVHPDDLPKLRAAVASAVERMGDINIEYRAVLPGGGTRWITLRGRVVPDILGEPARLLGAAYDRSRERELADSLEKANDRLQVLSSAGAALAATLSPHAVLDVLERVLVPEQAATLVLAVTPQVAELLGYGHPDARTDLVPARLKQADPALQSVLEDVIAGSPLTATAASGVGRAVRTGESQLLERVPDELLQARAVSPEHLEQMRSLNLGRSLSVPLATSRSTSGALTVTAGPGQDLDELLVTDLARRAAVALENALDHARAQQVTRALQSSLLPRTAAALPGVHVASRYLPAATGALAGGDFFKTLVVGDRIVTVLGDVMGHGAVSAARAGQLHAVIAALALQGLSPGELLGALSKNIDTIMDLELATVLVCSYEPVRRELVAATAGHPSPLLVRPGGSATYLELEPGAPLGVAVDTYPETVLALVPSDVVVLFSDGLVERRDDSLSDGLERLRTAAQALTCTTADVEELASGILLGLGCAGGAGDDVALLVMTHA